MSITKKAIKRNRKTIPMLPRVLQENMNTGNAFCVAND